MAGMRIRARAALRAALGAVVSVLVLSSCQPIELRNMLDKAVNGTPHMYYTERDAGRISVAETSGKNAHAISPLTGLTRPVMLAINFGAGRMYWTDNTLGNNRVMSSDLSGGNIKTISTNAAMPRGISLDLVNGKVYWITPSDAWTRRANLDGTGLEDYQNNEVNDYDILIDAAGINRYWTLYDQGSIHWEDIAMSGSNGSVVSGRTHPNDMAMDPSSGDMYWSEEAGGISCIAAADFGNDLAVRQVISAADAQGPRDLALDMAGGKIYWASADSSSIKRANLNGTNVEVLISGLTTPRGIVLDLTPR